MAFTTVLTDSVAISPTAVTAYDRSFIVANTQADVMDQFVQFKQDIGAKAVVFPRFGSLAVATTPLTEGNDLTSVALVDQAVTFTPAEYGNVVTRTSLASLQTGGVVDVAAATVVGINMAETRNALATQALAASSNQFYINGKTDATLATSDIITQAFMNQAYNKLARANIPTLGESYVMVAHDDVIADLRDDVGVGSWIDVSKYSSPETVLRNEVGMYKGFRVIRNNHAVGINQSGGGFVDDYPVYFMGFNALGKAISKEEGMVATGPFDKLARFVNLGWYGVFNYGIVEQNAVWVGHVASSLGANAS